MSIKNSCKLQLFYYAKDIRKANTQRLLVRLAPVALRHLFELKRAIIFYFLL